VFDGLLTLTMPVLLSAETLDEIQKRTQMEVFPCVGLASENKKVLSELFPNRKAAPPKVAKTVAPGRNVSGAWQSLFDVADERVKKDIGSGAGEASARQNPARRKSDAPGPLDVLDEPPKDQVRAKNPEEDAAAKKGAQQPARKDGGTAKPVADGGLQQTPGRPASGKPGEQKPKAPSGTNIFDIADDLVKKDLGKKP
jgi:hypothetical protein